MHKLLLKKIYKEIQTGQSILHITSSQNDLENLLKPNNQYLKINNLAILEDLNINVNNKNFTYVIADMDEPLLDDFEIFLNQIAPCIIRPGLLILIASSLMSEWFSLFTSNPIIKYPRPYRAVTPGFLRNSLIEQGFKIKNRFWQFDNKLLVMADIPTRY